MVQTTTLLEDLLDNIVGTISDDDTTETEATEDAEETEKAKDASDQPIVANIVKPSTYAEV